MTTPQIIVVRQKSTGLYLRMTKFDPVTQAPLYGPMEAAWIADSEPQAIAQAGFLGEDDHEPVRVTFTTSDLSQFYSVSPETASAVLANANTRIAFKPQR